MAKKYVLTTAMAAFLAAASIAQAPEMYHPIPKVSEIETSNLIRSLLPEDIRKDIEQREKAMENAVREIRLCERDEIYRHIYRAYKKIDVPEYLTKRFVRAQIWAESWDTPNAVGTSGERGLLQIMPGTWKKIEPKLSFKYAFNPEINVYAGMKHLLSVDRQLETRNNKWGNLNNEEKRKLITAAYNCGVGGLIKSHYNLDRVPDTTKRYVRHIEKLMSKKYVEY